MEVGLEVEGVDEDALGVGRRQDERRRMRMRGGRGRGRGGRGGGRRLRSCRGVEQVEELEGFRRGTEDLVLEQGVVHRGDAAAGQRSVVVEEGRVQRERESGRGNGGGGGVLRRRRRGKAASAAVLALVSQIVGDPRQSSWN